MLSDKIFNKEPGIMTYGITPPKRDHDYEKLLEIAQKQMERIRRIDIDALVVYDIQDEADRTKDERTFPFIETVDPGFYAKNFLSAVDLPKIVYRCVGKYTKEQLADWTNSQERMYSVFVGAASKHQPVTLSLKEAYRHVADNEHLVLGGVTIPERHITRKDEHLKVIQKCNDGCKFFISQVTYNAQAAKDFLSDYYYFCEENRIAMVPILFTLTPCGSVKTLEFMKWLGISIPRWLENDLQHSKDILERSLQLSQDVFTDIFEFCREKNIPAGCNIESLSTRKVEIDASIQLVEEIGHILHG